MESGDPILDAQRRARRLYPRSKGFRNTYIRGVRAALAGQSIETCPYKRSSDQSTWRQAWRLAWLRGYHSVSVAGET